MSDTLARDDTRLDRALFIDIRRLSIISWMNILSIWKPSRTKSDTNASLTRTIVRLSYYFEFHYFFAHGCLFIYRHEHKDTNTRLFPRVSLAMTRLIPSAWQNLRDSRSTSLYRFVERSIERNRVLRDDTYVRAISRTSCHESLEPYAREEIIARETKRCVDFRSSSDLGSFESDSFLFATISFARSFPFPTLSLSPCDRKNSGWTARSKKKCGHGS